MNTARGLARVGGGYTPYVEPPPEWRGTTVQVCGLYPFAVGGAAPSVGVPLGTNLLTGATVCCDPINWFTRANLLLNPSAFVLGLPALGKSTLVRRQVLGLVASGVRVLVLGDTKPDYRDLVLALGGQVLSMGRGRDVLNPLDPGAMTAAAKRLTGTAAAELREEAHGRRLNMVIALVTMLRGAAMTDTERTVLARALKVLADAHEHTAAPVLADLVEVLTNPPEAVRLPTLDRGDELRYREATDPLLRSLLGMLDGEFGAIFSGQTSTPLRLDAPAVCVDVSGLHAADANLEAAVLLATWSEGYGAIESANALADAGVAPQRRFLTVLDELWRVLLAGPNMVQRVNALTRLNRAHGTGQISITHTLSDLKALRTQEERAMAKGFAERAGMLMLGGLPSAEIDDLQGVTRLSQAERNMITSWSTPTSLAGGDAHRPGVGKFLLKVGTRPGVPVQVKLTRAELEAAVHDTNRRWREPVDPTQAAS